MRSKDQIHGDLRQPMLWLLQLIVILLQAVALMQCLWEPLQGELKHLKTNNRFE